MRQRWVVMAAGVAALAVCTGCATPSGGGSAAGDGVPNPSGFLQDYTKLRPVPGRSGRYAWMASDAELRQYTRFLLPPMEIWIDKDAQYRGVAADTVQRLAEI
jgi:hypothetical protein